MQAQSDHTLSKPSASEPSDVAVARNSVAAKLTDEIAWTIYTPDKSDEFTASAKPSLADGPKFKGFVAAPSNAASLEVTSLSSAGNDVTPATPAEIAYSSLKRLAVGHAYGVTPFTGEKISPPRNAFWDTDSNNTVKRWGFDTEHILYPNARAVHASLNSSNDAQKILQSPLHFNLSSRTDIQSAFNSSSHQWLSQMQMRVDLNDQKHL